jgi:hypothetical protein
MKKASPFGFRESIGPKVRLFSAFAFLVLTGAVLYLTITGLEKGEMYLGSKYGSGTMYDRAQNPTGFWITTTINFGICAFLGYFSIREIRFTATMRKEKKLNQSSKPSRSARG